MGCLGAAASMLELLDPERKDTQMNASAVPNQVEISATTKAVATAHHAPIDAATRAALWERRGFLRRLTRKAG